MRFDTLYHKLHQRGKDKIAFHPFPDKMKLVRAEPHVCSGTTDLVLLLNRIVLYRARIFYGSDINVVVKDSEIQLL
jgi:hypothetical protein